MSQERYLCIEQYKLLAKRNLDQELFTWKYKGNKIASSQFLKISTHNL